MEDWKQLVMDRVSPDTPRKGAAIFNRELTGELSLTHFKEASDRRAGDDPVKDLSVRLSFHGYGSVGTPDYLHFLLADRHEKRET